MGEKRIVMATAVVAFLLLGAHSVLAAESVNINMASVAELDAIVGVGPTLAQRIIEARPFTSLDDLLKVKGIGEKTLQKIKDQGLASVSGQTMLFKEESSQQKKELPNEEKSDTKVSVATSAVREPLPNNLPYYQNPKTLFLIILGFILIAGGIKIFLNFKIINRKS